MNSPLQSDMERRMAEELEKRNSRDDIMQMMRLEGVACSAEGRWVHMRHSMEPWEINLMGSMHGGLITFLLDSIMAITSRVYTGDLITPTVDIHVSFLAPVEMGKEIHLRATIVHVGSKILHVSSQIWQEDEASPRATANAIFYRAKKAQEDNR